MGFGGLTATLASGAEFGRRRLRLLAPPSCAWVIPEAKATAGEIDAVLVLQRNANPSTDYYLRPRLPERKRALIVDLDRDPASTLRVLRGLRVCVVICRYVTPTWRKAIEELVPARVVYFMDDDLPAVVGDVSTPSTLRGKVAAYYGRHVAELSRLATDVWVSTPALAARHPFPGVVIVPPVPEADPPEPDEDGPPLVVYHATDGHAEERRFVLEVARRLQHLAPFARVEVTGDKVLARSAADQPNLTVVPQTSWPAYLAAQTGRRAAVFLAPLSRSRVNDARAPVKAFDAARLGAAAVFADHPVFRSWTRPGVDGVLAQPDPDAFAVATADLLVDAGRRVALANAARSRLLALRRDVGALPGLAS